jgi:hypothetical protein
MNTSINKILTTSKSIILAVTVALVPITIKAAENGNPLVNHIFTADPSAHVFENRVYVYGSHDLPTGKGYKMTDYHVLSSADLVNWEDHGLALSLDDVQWAKDRMWAPDAIYKDGTYYFYFPARGKDKTFRVGVATSDSPAGPFVAEPNFIEGTDEIDPAVFIDDDGQAYIYWGGRSVKVAKLDDSMKKLKGDIVKLQGVDYFYEAAWMHKLGDTYYLSYSSKFHPETKDHIIVYATAKNPLGPFTFQGIVNGNVSGITNHHSTVEYKGQWYLFYHNSELSGGINTRRSIVADYLHFNDDGSIREVIQTKLGIGRYDGLKPIEAENYSETLNVQKRESQDGGLHIVFDDKDKVIFNNIDFGETLVNTIQFKILSKYTGGKLMIRSKVGTLLATLDIPQSMDTDKWKFVSAQISPISGKKDFSFTYLNEIGGTLRVDNVVFIKQ